MFVVLETSEFLQNPWDRHNGTPMFGHAAALHGLTGNEESENELRFYTRELYKRLEQSADIWIEIDENEIRKIEDLLDLSESYAVLCEPSVTNCGSPDEYLVRTSWEERVRAAKPPLTDPHTMSDGTTRHHLLNTATWIEGVREFFSYLLETDLTLAWFDPYDSTAETMGWELKRWSSVEARARKASNRPKR